MADLFLLPFVISIVFFIGAFFTDSEKKGTLIKAFLFIVSAGSMTIALYAAQVPTVTVVAYPAYNVIVAGQTTQYPAYNITNYENPVATGSVQGLGWLLVLYWAVCVLFALFALLTGGVTANQ